MVIVKYFLFNAHLIGPWMDRGDKKKPSACCRWKTCWMPSNETFKTSDDFKIIT